LLLEADIDPIRRAQTLDLDEWAALYNAYRGLAATVLH
jgi:hypothetical protein